MNKEALTKINDLVVDNIACAKTDKLEILSFIDETLRGHITKPLVFCGARATGKTSAGQMISLLINGEYGVKGAIYPLIHVCRFYPLVMIDNIDQETFDKQGLMIHARSNLLVTGIELDIVDNPIICHKENQNEYFDITEKIEAIRKERTSILKNYQFSGVQIF